MRLPSEVELFTCERRHMQRAWWRKRRGLSPECVALLALLALAAGFWLAAPPPRPAAVASIAPLCADAAQPCRGVR